MKLLVFLPLLAYACAACPTTNCGEGLLKVPVSPSNILLESPGFDGKADYCPDLRCKWNLEAAEGHKITIDFYKFNVDTSDALYIYDGSTTEAKMIRFLSGDRSADPPKGIKTTGNRAVISFSTNADPKAVGTGFMAAITSQPSHNQNPTNHPSVPIPIVTIPNKPKAPATDPPDRPVKSTVQEKEVNEVCPSRAALLTPDQGTYHFWTPNFPGPYPANALCLWFISSPPGSKINITLWSEFSTDECCGKMTLYEGNGTTGSKIAELSGQYQKGSSIIVPNIVTIKFDSSSNQDSRTGFHAGASAFSLPTTTVPPTTSKFPSNFTTRPPDDCGSANRSILAGEIGRITSPNYPYDYPDNLDCIWYLGVPEGSRLNLTFTGFDTEPYMDTLTVYGATDMNKYSKLGEFWGDKMPYSITAMGNFVMLEFKTSYYNSRRGFEATFKASPGRQMGVFDTADDNGALLLTPFFPNNFGSYETVRYDISVPSYQAIKIDFIYFYTDSSATVNVYKHHSTMDGDRIRQYSNNHYGDLFTMTVCTSESQATFEFVSDNTDGLGQSQPLGVLAYYTPISQNECFETVVTNSVLAIAAYAIALLIQIILMIIAIAVFVKERRYRKRAILAGHGNDTKIKWESSGCLVVFIIGLFVLAPLTVLVVLICACCTCCRRRKAGKKRVEQAKEAEEAAKPPADPPKEHEHCIPVPAPVAEVVEKVEEVAEEVAEKLHLKKAKKHKKRKQESSSSESSSESSSSESEPPTPKPKRKHRKHRHAKHAPVVSGFVDGNATSMYPNLVAQAPTPAVVAAYTNPAYNRPISPVIVQQVPPQVQPLQVSGLVQPQVQYVQPQVHYQPQQPMLQARPEPVQYQQQPAFQPQPMVAQNTMQTQAPPMQQYPVSSASYYGYSPY